MKTLLAVMALLFVFSFAGAATDVEAEITQTHQQVQAYVDKTVGTFESYQQYTLGDPAAKLMEVAVAAKNAGLPGMMMTLATVIAMVGFFVRGWAILTTGDAVSKRGVVVQAVVVAVLLSLSFNNPLNKSVSYGALQSWNNALHWSNSKFTSAMDAKLAESSKIMVGLLGKVAVTATTLAAPELRAVGAASGKAAMGSAVKGVAKKAGGYMSRIAAKLNFSLLFMQGLVVAYAQIIYISGIAVLVGVYLFPVAAALTLWGQTRPIWMIVGSFLSAWAIAMILPLVTYLSIDKVFVEPARMAAVYSDKIDTAVKTAGLQSSIVGETFDRELDRSVSDCKAKQEADPNVSCVSDSNQGMLKSLYTAVVKAVMPGVDILTGVVSDLLKTIGSAVIQIFWGAVFYLFAILAIFATAAFITNVLGGAATNLGNAIKGRVTQ